eukprot:TRINITY_DN13596_c0_g1_i1.p1 TRINITY_DN13596_c0_g1~~TRINITY_DN13596_c0_g1_i1.p1  ORF type:complete len:107 (+),score=9.29 TRINITY_DN13596_c0_g1_i1:193-513(+)
MTERWSRNTNVSAFWRKFMVNYIPTMQYPSTILEEFTIVRESTPTGYAYSLIHLANTYLNLSDFHQAQQYLNKVDDFIQRGYYTDSPAILETVKDLKNRLQKNIND